MDMDCLADSVNVILAERILDSSDPELSLAMDKSEIGESVLTYTLNIWNLDVKLIRISYSLWEQDQSELVLLYSPVTGPFFGLIVRHFGDSSVFDKVFR
jgi:hypothetical protein